MPLKKSLVSHPLLQGKSTCRVSNLIITNHSLVTGNQKIHVKITLHPEGVRCFYLSLPPFSDKFTSLKEQLNEFDRFVVGIPKVGEEKVGSGGFRNAFDIPRHNLLNHVLKMRKNFLHTSLPHIKLMDEGK